AHSVGANGHSPVQGRMAIRPYNILSNKLSTGMRGSLLPECAGHTVV
ncbi:hypothetical protein H6G82_26405, partial [Planktothricoides sp. FACHB-1261]|nr:hypothetical protein [Planktothricoides raciborskii FACHB-1261]